MIDSTPSYRCKISDGNTRGTLYLGKRRVQADVLEMSRDSFCVRVPSRIAKKVSVGGKNKLMYQEMLWSVRCTHKWIGESNSVDIELQQLQELTPPKLNRGPASFQTKQFGLGQSDPALPAAFLGTMILIVLVLPAWGGNWGTSDAICAAISNTWSALKGLAAGGQ